MTMDSWIQSEYYYCTYLMEGEDGGRERALRMIMVELWGTKEKATRRLRKEDRMEMKRAA